MQAIHELLYMPNGICKLNTVSLIENLLGVLVGILIEAQDGFNEQAQHFILREVPMKIP